MVPAGYHICHPHQHWHSANKRTRMYEKHFMSKDGPQILNTTQKKCTKNVHVQFQHKILQKILRKGFLRYLSYKGASTAHITPISLIPNPPQLSPLDLPRIRCWLHYLHQLHAQSDRMTSMTWSTLNCLRTMEFGTTCGRARCTKVKVQEFFCELISTNETWCTCRNITKLHRSSVHKVKVLSNQRNWDLPNTSTISTQNCQTKFFVSSFSLDSVGLEKVFSSE